MVLNPQSCQQRLRHTNSPRFWFYHGEARQEHLDCPGAGSRSCELLVERRWVLDERVFCVALLAAEFGSNGNQKSSTVNERVIPR